MAANRGHDVGGALAETRAFLQSPAGWTANKSHGDDEGLMRLQFAAALAAAGEKDLTPAPALVEAAKIVLADQMQDGSWVPDASDPPNSPLTWGTAVATWMARSTLINAGREPDDFSVAQTDRWLRTVEVETVPDAAGVVLGLGVTSDVMADKQRARYLNLLRFAQRESGGWGPLPNAERATAFDTALVLLALAAARDRSAFGPFHLPRGGAEGGDWQGPRISREPAESRRQLARDHARERDDQRRAAPVHDRVGADGPARGLEMRRRRPVRPNLSASCRA